MYVPQCFWLGETLKQSLSFFLHVGCATYNFTLITIFGQSGHLLHQTKGDGNCLFQALAFQPLVDEDEHFCV